MLFKRLVSAAFLFPLAVLAGCSGSTNSGTSSSGSTSSGGSSGTLSGGLAGTWDLTGSSGTSAPTTGVLTIDASTFLITIGDTTLSMNAAGDQATLTFRDPSHAPVITTTHQGSSSVSLGAIPLDFLGGSWTFEGQPGASQARVTATVTPDAVTAQGANISGQPSEIPHLEGSFTAGRTSHLDSIFGDLGGEWVLTASDTTINAKFSGSTFTATVAPKFGKPGTLTATVADGVVSGTTTDGLEFSARRR
jgi:hypothetical protein